MSMGMAKPTPELEPLPEATESHGHSTFNVEVANLVLAVLAVSEARQAAIASCSYTR